MRTAIRKTGGHDVSRVPHRGRRRSRPRDRNRQHSTRRSRAEDSSGSVGPGFSIKLELGGRNVTRLTHGPYRFVINDRSSIHDFHLTGPGLNRILTTVDFVGTKSVVLTLKKGVYKYVCDPHSELMHGSFRVV